MKLLGWMHRKFRQNSTEPFKDLIIGNSWDEDPKEILKNVKQSSSISQKEVRKYCIGGVEDEEYEDSAGGMYELFHGFLAIGTLGLEASITTTPTFAISVENIITEKEKEDEVTENELKLINDELEKVLLDDESSLCGGRNSHVSNGRSSHGSIITLSGGKLPLLEAADQSSNIGIGNAICPLQGYLFGSAIELSETTTTTLVSASSAVTKNKEHRTSLGELFQRTKFADQDNNNNFNGAKDDKSAMHLMKKILKKRMLHTSASADTKLHKILHMFHRKVHPENSTGVQKCDKYQKYENKKKTMNEGGHNKSDPEEDIMIHPKRALSKENMRQYKIQPNPLQFTLDCCEEDSSSENKEHWIKTDADYLVLEL